MNPDHAYALPPSRSRADSSAAGGPPRTVRSRRAALRALAGSALAAPALLRAPAAGAIKGWCRRDPVVMIGNRTVHIVLLSAATMHDHATGPTQLVITVPAGSSTRFLADDPGFGRYGYDVRFTESRAFAAEGGVLDVQVDAYAPATNPASGPLPVVLEFTPRGDGEPVTSRAEGRANEWVRLRASLEVNDLPETGSPPPTNGPGQPDTNGHGKKKGRKGRRDKSNGASNTGKANGQGRKTHAP